jgi:hypothetical protein
MPDDKLAAFAVICTEEHTTQRIGVDVALEPHLRPALHVEDHAVTVVCGCLDWLRARFSRHLQEFFAIGRVEPGQTLPHLIGVDTATGDGLDLGPFSRQNRGAREVAEVGIIGHRSNVLLPACGKVPIQVERGPAESCGHASDYQLRERHRHRRGHLGSGAVAIPLSASTSVGA